MGPEGPKIFSDTEQISSRIRVSDQNFEKNGQFLRALPAGRISHFTSRIYPSPIQSGVHCFMYHDQITIGIHLILVEAT